MTPKRRKRISARIRAKTGNVSLLLIAATTSFPFLLLSAFLLMLLWSLPTILNFRANLHFPLSRNSLLRPFLIVLPHYRVTRPVTVIPLLELLLLLQLVGIAIP